MKTPNAKRKISIRMWVPLMERCWRRAKFDPPLRVVPIEI